MADKKERIMDLMRKGIITQDEALELLEKSDSSFEDFEEADQSNKKREFDNKGYEKHKVDVADSIKGTLSQVADTVTDVFKGLSQKVDDNVDFSNGWPKVKSTPKTEEFDITEDFHSVCFEAKAGKIGLYPGNNAHIRLTYKVYGAVRDIDAYLAENARVEVEDGELEIFVGGNRTSVEMALYLPEKEYDKISLNLLNGNVSLEGIVANDLTLSSKNGELYLQNTKTDKLALDLINGEIKFDGSFVEGDVSLGNGNIRLSQQDSRARKLSAKNINGDIKLSVPEALGLTGHVRTIFGGYKTRLRLDQPFEVGKNGAVVVRAGEEGLTFDIETKSGTIWLKDAE